MAVSLAFTVLHSSFWPYSFVILTTVNSDTAMASDVCYCVAAEGVVACTDEHYNDVAEIPVKLEPGDAPVVKAVDNKVAGINVNDALPVKLKADNVTPLGMITDAVDLQPLDTGNYCHIGYKYRLGISTIIYRQVVAVYCRRGGRGRRGKLTVLLRRIHRGYVGFFLWVGQSWHELPIIESCQFSAAVLRFSDKPKM